MKKIRFFNHYGLDITFDLLSKTYVYISNIYKDQENGFLAFDMKNLSDCKLELSRICALPKHAFIFFYCGEIIDESVQLERIIKNSYESIPNIAIHLSNKKCPLHCCPIHTKQGNTGANINSDML